MSDGPRPLGDSVVEFISGATSTVTLVAPFMKCDALDRLLRSVPAGVSVTCYTRWRPDEIVAGVSDLAVWPMIRDRHGRLRLRYDLHAKLFRADRECLAGSPNVTGAALGWVDSANLELLVRVSADDEVILTFFRELDLGAVDVTNAIYDDMVAVVEAYPAAQTRSAMSASVQFNSLSNWLPRCRVPGNHNLYRTYTKQWNIVNHTTYEDAEADIAALGVPPDMSSEPEFLRYITAILRLSPAVAFVRERAVDGIQLAQGQELIAEVLGLGNGPDGEITGEEWWTLSAWLTTLLHHEFRQRQGISGPELVRSVRIL